MFQSLVILRGWGREVGEVWVTGGVVVGIPRLATRLRYNCTSSTLVLVIDRRALNVSRACCTMAALVVDRARNWASVRAVGGGVVVGDAEGRVGVGLFRCVWCAAVLA
jgi:hypothetical protein